MADPGSVYGLSGLTDKPRSAFQSTALFRESEAGRSVYDYIEPIRNLKRMHSTSGYCGPLQQEKYSNVV